MLARGDNAAGKKPEKEGYQDLAVLRWWPGGRDIEVQLGDVQINGQAIPRRATASPTDLTVQKG